jgi:hypothetical protein
VWKMGGGVSKNGGPTSSRAGTRKSSPGPAGQINDAIEDIGSWFVCTTDEMGEIGSLLVCNSDNASEIATPRVAGIPFQKSRRGPAPMNKVLHWLEEPQAESNRLVCPRPEAPQGRPSGTSAEELSPQSDRLSDLQRAQAERRSLDEADRLRVQQLRDERKRAHAVPVHPVTLRQLLQNLSLSYSDTIAYHYSI